MKVAITSPDQKSDLDIEGTPWIHFSSALMSMGHRIVELDENPQCIIFNNYSSEIWKSFGSKLPVENLFLFVWEPPENCPRNFHQETLRKFKNIYFPSPYWAEKYQGKQFKWPQKDAKEYAKTSFQHWNLRQKKFCFIQKNRWNLSKGSQYSLRRKVVAANQDFLDVFGGGWNQGLATDLAKSFFGFKDSLIRKSLDFSNLWGVGRRFNNVHGPVLDKMEVLSKYKYSLVIENSESYVSEKLFDVLLSGTVPLYVGPRIEDFGIPREVAFICGSKPEDIQKAMICLMNDSDLSSNILKEGSNFVQSHDYKQFVNSNVFTNLAKEVANYLSHQHT